MRLQFTFLTFFSFFITLGFAQKAPDFKVTTIEGQQIGLYADYLDQGTTVVLELFFVDCPPCNNLAPYMGDLHAELKSKNVAVEFISLSDKSWDNNEKVTEFKKKYNHDWQFVSPDGGSLEAVKVYEDGTYGQFWGTPTTIVIAPDGSVNYNVRGSIGTNWTDNLKVAIIESQTTLNEVGPPMATITGNIGRADNQGIGGVELKFTGGKDTTILTKADGSFETGSLLADASYTVAASKTGNAGNGVTTLDIVLITKHILGIDTFSQQQQLIAGDVNRSGLITTLDIVRMRQLILGITTEFPDAPSWVFEPSEISLANLNNLSALSFIGTKIGDVNNTADPAQLLAAEPRNTMDKFELLVADKVVKKGEIYSVDLSTKNLIHTLGFQFTLNFDQHALQFVDVAQVNLSGFTKNNLNLDYLNRGWISTSWDNLTPQEGTDLFTLRFKANKNGYLRDMLSVNSALTKAEAYTFDYEPLNIELNFEKETPLMVEKATIFPNPAGNEGLNLSFSLEKAQQIEVKVMDLNGRILSNQQYDLSTGLQQLELDAAKFNAGIYLVQILQGEKIMETLKFVKE